VINRNCFKKVYTKNAYAFNSTSNAFLTLSTQMIRIIQTICSNKYSITSPISKSSLLKMGFSSIKWKSMGQKSASTMQSTWPMRISRTLSTILSKSAERFGVEGPTYPKRNNALDFNIVFKDETTIQSTGAAGWNPKNGPVSSAEPQYRSLQSRLSATIASAPLRMRRQNGIRAQSNSVVSVTRGYLEFGLGRITSHLSGSLSGNELFNLMQPILPSRFKLVLQLLKKSGLTVLDRCPASSNRMMIFKPFAGIKLGPQPKDAGTLAPYYHALWKSPGSKIRSKESELNLLYYSPKKEQEKIPVAHISEDEFGRKNVLRKDTMQNAALDLDQFSDQICSIIEKRLKVERERRGLYG
jgi:hypothetical protein